MVVLTGSRFERDILATKELGAVACLIKPVGFQQLLEVVPQLQSPGAAPKPAKKTARAGK